MNIDKVTEVIVALHAKCCTSLQEDNIYCVSGYLASSDLTEAELGQ